MKLASYTDGSRDGQLVVVSRDLKSAHYATGAATRLQHLLDDWGFVSPQLQDIYDALNQGRLRHAFPFDPASCAAPLPRAHLWARIDDTDADAGCDAVRFGPSDHLAGARDPIIVADETHAVRAHPSWAAIMGDVPRGASPGAALEGVRLLMLAIETRLHDGSILDAAFGPVALTPDEFGTAWKGGRLHVRLRCMSSNEPERPHLPAAEARAGIGDVVAALARHRAVAAGSIIGAGAMSPLGSSGSESGVSMRVGDRVRIDAAEDSASAEAVTTRPPTFGLIDRQVIALSDFAVGTT